MLNELILNIEIQMPNFENDYITLSTRQLLADIKKFDVKSADLVKRETNAVGSKSVDPVVIGAVVITLLPNTLAQVLQFLHDWSLRKEGRTIKIKVQSKDGAIVEIEVPETISPVEVNRWISMVKKQVVKTKR